MKPNPEFQKLPKSFWAAIRTVGQACGYTVRGTGQIKVPQLEEIKAAFEKLSLNKEKLTDAAGHPSDYAAQIISYCKYRADVLNGFVEPHLMDVTKAKRVFEDLKRRLKPKCPLPMNKQKGNKKAYNYLTGIVNMLIEQGIGKSECNYDPRQLTTITKDGLPLRTLARRVDGAFPSPVNPIAVWEIKEYYYTTTFGSRVADGVYETLLDGMELEEMQISENHNILHYLIIDAHYTWWDCGRSYLCRIIDMLNMGYVDEVFFGYEVVEKLSDEAASWVHHI